MAHPNDDRRIFMNRVLRYSDIEKVQPFNAQMWLKAVWFTQASDVPVQLTDEQAERAHHLTLTEVLGHQRRADA